MKLIERISQDEWNIFLEQLPITSVSALLLLNSKKFKSLIYSIIFNKKKRAIKENQVVEESTRNLKLKLQGHNRFDVVNALKQYLCNGCGYKLDINRKEEYIRPI